MDNLSELFKTLNAKQADSVFKKNKLHRTKCTMIIKHVINASIRSEITTDVQGKKYSLIIDESTDCAVLKYLCICIRYFSDVDQKIVTHYLGLLEITNADANTLAEAIEGFLAHLGIEIKNMIGLGTDGASNLCGKNHSVFTILKAKAPRLQLVKCIAHSLHLCALKAADTLPSSLDFLCSEIYNWFKVSTCC